MKIRVLDRLLVAISGLVLIALSAALVAETFFAIPLAETLGGVFINMTTTTIVILASVAAVLLLLGIYCFCLLFRHGKGKRGFVLQKTENGELSISVKAMENMVQKCVDKHDELHVLSTALENTRDGLVIKLRIGLASGVNIPLAVNALQKQIKQYITTCSGVDVREVRVQVETAAAKVKDSPYAVPDAIQNVPMTPDNKVELSPSPVDASASTVPPVAAIPTREELKEKDTRPLHQRLFGREETPVIVPQPPEPFVIPETEATESADASANGETQTTETSQAEEDQHEIAE